MQGEITYESNEKGRFAKFSNQSKSILLPSLYVLRALGMTGRQNSNLAVNIKKVIALSYSIYDAVIHIGMESLLICADLLQIIKLVVGKHIYQEML